MYVPDITKRILSQTDAEIDADDIEQAYLDAHDDTVSDLGIAFWLDENGYNQGDASDDDLITVFEKWKLTPSWGNLDATALIDSAKTQDEDAMDIIRSSVLTELDKRFAANYENRLEQLIEETD